MKRNLDMDEQKVAGSSYNSSDCLNDDHYMESAKQYILEHGKKPPMPGNLKGRAIGMWHSKMARLRKSLLPDIEPNPKGKKRGKALGDVALSKAKQSEIKAVLEGLPDKIDQPSCSYSHIKESQFKKEFLQNINGKLEDNMEVVEQEQDDDLDDILFNELEEKQKNHKYVQMLERRSTLPSTEVKSKIIDLVESNQVILISGETGCGKTTQVPQFLLDHFIENKKGSLCKIVCTQPRRISAISVAERVAEERAERLGLSSGYQIRMENVKSKMKPLSDNGNDKFFIYNEDQNYLNELSELMTYEELTNVDVGPYRMKSNVSSDHVKYFNTFSEEKKIAFIRLLMDQLETVNHDLRMEAARSVLYIILGGVDNKLVLEKDNESAAQNTMLVFRLGMFPLIINMLNMERTSKIYRKNQETRSATNDICVILNILSIIIERMLIQKRSEHNSDVEIFIKENLSSEENDSLLFILLDMMAEFASYEKPGYPIKKILLLIWKIIMISFGSLKDLFHEKKAKRIKCGLNNNHLHELEIDSGKYHLPLLQKVSKKDLNNFLHKMSLKYREMKDTIAIESIESLQKHLYIPLSELQLKKGFPHSKRIEKLYKNMLPNMKLYVERLLQIFQISIRIPVMNMFGDCNEKIMTISSYAPFMVLGKFHIFENMEIMNKAISGILLLLLKHFKLNHVYQFEHLSDVMVACGAIPLLKTYLERTTELFIVLSKSRNRRNLFACVNVLRILNKLVKGNYARTRMLLKLNVKHLKSLTSLRNKHLEVYSLKLLKILSKLLGKRWRQENMVIMNKIFLNLRHRLLEDNSPGVQNNNSDEEMLLKRIYLFNTQYMDIETDRSIEENDLSFELTDFFKENYETWLEEEVFRNPFDWDILLDPSCV